MGPLCPIHNGYKIGGNSSCLINVFFLEDTTVSERVFVYSEASLNGR